MLIENLPEAQKGNTLMEIDIDFFNDDGTEYDMTNALAFVEFRRYDTDGVIVANLALGSGLSWTDSAKGKLRIEQIDELNWELGTYYYDVRIKEVNYPLYTPVGGQMEVVNIVTKRKS